MNIILFFFILFFHNDTRNDEIGGKIFSQREQSLFVRDSFALLKDEVNRFIASNIPDATIAHELIIRIANLSTDERAKKIIFDIEAKTDPFLVLHSYIAFEYIVSGFLTSLANIKMAIDTGSIENFIKAVKNFIEEIDFLNECSDFNDIRGMLFEEIGQYCTEFFLLTESVLWNHFFPEYIGITFIPLMLQKNQTITKKQRYLLWEMAEASIEIFFKKFDHMGILPTIENKQTYAWGIECLNVIYNEIVKGCNYIIAPSIQSMSTLAQHGISLIDLFKEDWVTRLKHDVEEMRKREITRSLYRARSEKNSSNHGKKIFSSYIVYEQPKDKVILLAPPIGLNSLMIEGIKQNEKIYDQSIKKWNKSIIVLPFYRCEKADFLFSDLLTLICMYREYDGIDTSWHIIPICATEQSKIIKDEKRDIIDYMTVSAAFIGEENNRVGITYGAHDFLYEPLSQQILSKYTTLTVYEAFEKSEKNFYTSLGDGHITILEKYLMNQNVNGKGSDFWELIRDNLFLKGRYTISQNPFYGIQKDIEGKKLLIPSSYINGLRFDLSCPGGFITYANSIDLLLPPEIISDALNYQTNGWISLAEQQYPIFITIDKNGVQFV